MQDLERHRPLSDRFLFALIDIRVAASANAPHNFKVTIEYRPQQQVNVLPGLAALGRGKLLNRQGIIPPLCGKLYVGKGLESALNCGR